MAIDRMVYAYIAEEENYPDGAVLIQEGTKNDCVYIILEGNVKIKKKIPRGQVTLATLKDRFTRILTTDEAIREIDHVSGEVSRESSTPDE